MHCFRLLWLIADAVSSTTFCLHLDASRQDVEAYVMQHLQMFSFSLAFGLEPLRGQVLKLSTSCKIVFGVRQRASLCIFNCEYLRCLFNNACTMTITVPFGSDQNPVGSNQDPAIVSRKR